MVDKLLAADLQVLPITVVIPTIPPREEMLRRAINSVHQQTFMPAGGASLALDLKREGSAATRNRALDAVTTDWVAFLDDDDILLPWHLQVCWDAAQTTGADVVYPGCEVIRQDGTWMHHDDHQLEWGAFGVPFDLEALLRRSYIPVTSLVRTSLAKRARFGAPDGSAYDDWGFYLRLLDLGAEFEHVPVRSWVWYHHGHNTSGQPDRW